MRTTGMSRSGNDGPGGFVILGSAGCRRVEGFRNALRELGLPPGRLVTYSDVLEGRSRLENVIRQGDILRIESPGKSVESEGALLRAGFSDTGPDALSREDIERLQVEKGRLVHPRQWYLGLSSALERVEDQRTQCPPHRAMQCPAAIRILFDKPRCHQILARNGIPVPKSPGRVERFDELLAAMGREKVNQVFVKSAFGSSGSGIVAFRMNRDRMLAISTTEMVEHHGECRLYNSRRIQRYDQPREIARLIDGLCRFRVHVEQWIPKATLGGKGFDLRVVVIGGRARHRVIRLSRSPMTNLHLLNERFDEAPLLNMIRPGDWQAALDSCERAARLFPDHLAVGIDLAFAAGLRRHFILEANAFGDLLPGVRFEGDDTYTSEIRELLNRQC